MKDETYSFISDVKEKGTVARSSHNRRSHTGSLSFKCPASVALNTLKDLLQNEMVAINITWRVIEEGGDDNG